MVGQGNQFEQLFALLAEALENQSDELAQAQYDYFESLQDAGFTEEQALEIVTSTQASQ